MPPQLLTYPQPVAININNASSFDPIIYIYVYPEFSYWAFKPDGITVDPVAVADIYTAFSSTNPYFPLTTSGFSFTNFNWRMYWLKYQLAITLPSYATTGFPLAQSNFTVTHNGTTINNTSIGLLKYMIANQLERLCILHYIRVGYASGFNTNDIRDDYITYTNYVNAGSVPIFNIISGSLRSISTYLATASWELVNYSTTSTMLPNTGSWVSTSNTIMALVDTSHYTPFVQYTYSTPVLLSNVLTVNNNCAIFGTTTLTGSTTVSGNPIFKGASLTLAAANITLITPSYSSITTTGTIDLSSASFNINAGTATSITSPVYIAGTPTLQSTTTLSVPVINNVGTLCGTLSAPRINLTGTTLSNITNIPTNIVVTGSNALVNNYSATSANITSLSLSGATVNNLTVFNPPVITNVNYLTNEPSWATINATTTLTTAQLVTGGFYISGNTGTLNITLPTASQLTTALTWLVGVNDNLVFSVVNSSSYDATLLGNVGVTLPYAVVVYAGTIASFSLQRLTGNIYTLIVHDGCVPLTTYSPSGSINVNSNTTLTGNLCATTSMVCSSTLSTSTISATADVSTSSMIVTTALTASSCVVVGNYSTNTLAMSSATIYSATWGNYSTTASILASHLTNGFIGTSNINSSISLTMPSAVALSAVYTGPVNVVIANQTDGVFLNLISSTDVIVCGTSSIYAGGAVNALLYNTPPTFKLAVCC